MVDDVATNKCSECGEPVSEKRVTCPQCGHEYSDDEYSKSPEQVVKETPDEFQTELSRDKLEAEGMTDEGEARSDRASA